MSETYLYSDITTQPDMDTIHTDVAASAMTDKSIEYCEWDEEPALLQVHFTNSLSGGDKTILDGVVADNS